MTTHGERIPAMLLVGILDYLESRGFARASLGAELGVDPAALEEPAAEIDLDRMRAAWGLAARLTRDSALGLHLGENELNRSNGLLGLIFAHSATVGDALEVLCRYFDSLTGQKALLFRVSARGGSIIRRHDTPSPLARAVVERAFAAIVSILRRETRGRFRVESLELSYAAPDCVADYARVFACPCHFDAERTAMQLSTATLALPMVNRDPLVRALLADELERRAAQRTRAYLPRVYATIAGLAENGSVSAPAVAQRLGVSERTLHRRLAADGTTFQAVLDAVRRDRAERLLAHSDRSTEEIAHACGFAEASSFHRAFRRWTGGAPSVYRRRQRAKRQPVSREPQLESMTGRSAAARSTVASSSRVTQRKAACSCACGAALAGARRHTNEIISITTVP